jgi:hypothetical protein
MPLSSYPALRRYWESRNEEQNQSVISLNDLSQFRELIVEILVHQNYTSQSGTERSAYCNFSGTGFFITSDFILTTYDTINDCHQINTLDFNISVRTADQKVRKAVLYAWDSLLNLALLKLENTYEKNCRLFPCLVILKN